MVSLPWTCEHCGHQHYHYGRCHCPDARLAWVDRERKRLGEEMIRLDNIERDILGYRVTSPTGKADG